MPTKQIVPPVTIWGGFSTGNGEQILTECFNNSGGTLAHGDVVVIDNSAGQMPAVAPPAPAGASGAITTSTTALDPKVWGVVSIDGTANTNGAIINPGAVCFVCVAGIARVQIGANVVALAAALGTTTTAKQAGSITATIGATLGFALEANTAKDANNTIRALVKSC